MEEYCQTEESTKTPLCQGLTRKFSKFNFYIFLFLDLKERLENLEPGEKNPTKSNWKEPILEGNPVMVKFVYFFIKMEQIFRLKEKIHL